MFFSFQNRLKGQTIPVARLTPDSFLNWMLSREWDYRVARNIERLVKGANF